jgi:hypothetical protein
MTEGTIIQAYSAINTYLYKQSNFAGMSDSDVTARKDLFDKWCAGKDAWTAIVESAEHTARGLDERIKALYMKQLDDLDEQARSEVTSHFVSEANGYRALWAGTNGTD